MNASDVRNSTDRSLRREADSPLLFTVELDYSVLMPLYYQDNPEWFRQSLESMLRQSVSPREIVIVHEYKNSTELDEVIAAARREYPYIKIVDALDESLVGKGLGGILAAGVQKCSCGLIARMDSDDIANEDRCEKQLAAFAAFPDLDLVGGWIEEFEDSAENVIAVRKVPESLDAIKAFSRIRNPFNHPTVMFRKDSVIGAGNYSPLPRCEDYDLWVRMISIGRKAINIQESLVCYRTNEEQRMRRKDRRAYDIRRMIKRGMLDRGEMGPGEYAWSMALDFANYHAPMRLYAWGTRHLLRSKKDGGR